MNNRKGGGVTAKNVTNGNPDRVGAKNAGKPEQKNSWTAILFSSVFAIFVIYAVTPFRFPIWPAAADGMRMQL